MQKFDQDQTGYLTYSEFKTWLLTNNKIMEVFSGSFHEEIWSL
jgi:hypothetical protein